MIRFCSVAIWLLALSAAALSQSGAGLQIEGLGPHRRHVSTAATAAQRFFDQGLNLMFAFNHGEAFHSFETASRIDPNCAMAYWGMAMAQGPEINRPEITDEEKRTAVRALQQAARSRRALTPVENSLLYAARVRYNGNESRHDLDRKYAAVMARIYAKYPSDPDVGPLYAEALMDLQPWDLWTHDGQPKGNTLLITRILDKAVRLAPQNPLALHLTIHAWEASATPERAIPAADRLRELQPGLGHNVHMPSHVYVRTGRWADAVLANQKAIAADAAYAAKRSRIGFYKLYMAHNGHMLGFAAMMTGQSKVAIEAMDKTFGAIPQDVLKEQAPMFDGYMSMPLEVRMRFGKWDEILDYPTFPDYLPIARTMQCMARGVAFAAMKKIPEAEAEQLQFDLYRSKISPDAHIGNNAASKILAIAEPFLRAEILLAKNQAPQAIDLLRTGVAAEDQITYSEPPDWVISTRHVLGVALLETGDFKGAEDVYRQDLKTWPNNGWSLYGLSEALRMQSLAEADVVKTQFAHVWKNADMQISSSCMCVPHPSP
jgi:tetratricopeptide (TPR) repeat protein